MNASEVKDFRAVGLSVTMYPGVPEGYLHRGSYEMHVRLKTSGARGERHQKEKLCEHLPRDYCIWF
jgi:hypothetical protein